MHAFLLDASALVKRYANETGAVVVDHLFAHATRDRLMCLMLGAAEVAAALVRKRNGGFITPTVFSAAMARLRTEVLTAEDLVKLPADNALITTAIPLSDKYAINANDAIVLQIALDLVAQRRTEGNTLVLVASDQRLLKAAQAEGLLTFDPERQTEVELDTLLAS